MSKFSKDSRTKKQNKEELTREKDKIPTWYMEEFLLIWKILQ